MRLERKHDCWVGSGMVRGRGSGGGDQDAGFRLTVARPRTSDVLLKSTDKLITKPSVRPDRLI